MRSLKPLYQVKWVLRGWDKLQSKVNKIMRSKEIL